MQAFHGRFRNVGTDTSAFSGGYWLEIEVVDFQAEYAPASAGGGAPTVHVHLVARIGNAGDRRMLGEFDADTRQPAANNRLTAIVAAYDDAANRALAEIVGSEDADALLEAGLETPLAPPLPEPVAPIVAVDSPRMRGRTRLRSPISRRSGLESPAAAAARRQAQLDGGLEIDVVRGSGHA